MQSLLYQRDTDFVRDNLLFNYLLGDEEPLLIESYIKNNSIPIHFTPNSFYMLITGADKKFTPQHTPQSFRTGIDLFL